MKKPDATPSDSLDWRWADPKSLQVNPAFQRLIPLQSRGELLALEQSIQREGCRDPLLVWKGQNVILDGHTRRELCLKLKQQVKIREIDLPDEAAAIAFILEIQRQRRNLTREAMSYFRGSEYNASKQQHGGNRRGRRSRDQNDPLIKTAQVLAQKYGVGEVTIKRDGLFAQAVDRIVKEYGDEEIRRKLLGADVKLTQGTTRVLLKMNGSEARKPSTSFLQKENCHGPRRSLLQALDPSKKRRPSSAGSRLEERNTRGRCWSRWHGSWGWSWWRRMERSSRASVPSICRSHA